MKADPMALRQPSDRTRESPFKAVLGSKWQTTQVTKQAWRRSRASTAAASSRERRTQDVGMKGKEPSIQWAFPLGSQPGLGGTRRPGRQPPPERPGADSGGQGPFPKAGGSYHQFFPRKAPLWALHSSVPRLSGKGPSWEGGKQALPGQDRASRALWSGGRKCPLALALVTTRMRSPSLSYP